MTQTITMPAPEVASASSIPAMLFEAARVHAGRPAIEDEGGVIDYAELPGQVLEVSRALIACAIEPGDRVAVWAPNGRQWIIAALGIQCAGAVLVPVNTRMKGPEAADVLERSGARILFVQGEFLGVDYARRTVFPGCRTQLQHAQPQRVLLR